MGVSATTHGSRFHDARRGIEVLERRQMLSGTPPTVTDVHVSSSEWSTGYVSYLSSHGMGSSLGYRIPAGTISQAKSLPWFNVDQITISFSKDVAIEKGALTLTGVGVPSIQPAELTYFTNQATNTHYATWTFASPFPKNVYQIDLNGDGIMPVASRADGLALDGEWTNGSDTMPSGNGESGGDFQFTFRVMPGDVNQNNGVDYGDYYACSLRQGFSTNAAGYIALGDVDGSGTIEAADAEDVMSKLWSAYPSGTPVGSMGDAPTTTGGGSVQITNAAIDVAISLWNAFADAETADSQLSYEIISNSNPSLFDFAGINVGSGNLVLNAVAGAAGRSEITVRATDASGQSATATFTADVNYVNQAPVLFYTISSEPMNAWRFIGHVADDAVVEGLVVNFTGAVDVNVSVHANGWFEFVVVVPESQWGVVYGIVQDRQGQWSNEIYAEIVTT